MNVKILVCCHKPGLINTMYPYFPIHVGKALSNQVLGIPGDSSNDAVIFFLDATSGKTSYVGFNTTSTGATEKMVGFVRWNSKTNRGTIIVMEYDSDANKKLFEKETGITGDGSLEQLKYNTWWINRIYKNPASLVNVLIEKEGLNKGIGIILPLPLSSNICRRLFVFFCFTVPSFFCGDFIYPCLTYI